MDAVTPTRTNEPVPPFVARRMLEQRSQGMYVHQIATHWSCCLSAVQKVLSHHRTTGLVRESVQGRGKRDDPRWIVAGPRGPGNLKAVSYTHLTLPTILLV